MMKCPLSLVVWFLRLAPQSPVDVVNEIEMFDSPSLTHFYLSHVADPKHVRDCNDVHLTK